VHDITAVDVVVKGFLDQVLRLEPRQLRHPETKTEKISFIAYTQNGFYNFFKFPFNIAILTYLASRKMSFRSRLALNINMFECILISVMALGGKECPTATRPTFWKQPS